MTAKIHAPSLDADARRYAAMSLCRMPGSRLDDEPANVTCKLCLELLARAAKVVHPVVPIGHAPKERDLDGLPVLTPETWAARDCTCGSCSVCLHLLEARRQAQFPPRHIRDQTIRLYRWSSVSDAIESYAVLRIDGFDAGKSIQQAIGELAQLGCFVDQTSRDPIRKSHAQAVEVSLFEQVLADAFEDFEGGWRRALAILLVRSIGVPERVTEKGKTRTVIRRIEDDVIAEAAGLSEAEVRTVVRRARQALVVELAARELVPPPSAKHRAWGAYEARVRELDETSKGAA